MGLCVCGDAFGPLPALVVAVVVSFRDHGVSFVACMYERLEYLALRTPLRLMMRDGGGTSMVPGIREDGAIAPSEAVVSVGGLNLQSATLRAILCVLFHV